MGKIMKQCLVCFLETPFSVVALVVSHLNLYAKFQALIVCRVLHGYNFADYGAARFWKN